MNFKITEISNDSSLSHTTGHYLISVHYM